MRCAVVLTFVFLQTGVESGASELRDRVGGRGGAVGLHAREPDGRDEQAGREHNSEGLLHGVRQGDRRPGDHGAGQDMASGALYMLALLAGAGYTQFLRARRPAVLRTGLPRPVLAPVRVLQRAHIGRKEGDGTD